MNEEAIFRVLFILYTSAMMAIRLTYQSKVLRDQQKFEIRESRLSLVAGAMAALTAIVFGAEYIFFPGKFPFAYRLIIPGSLRWLGFLVLAGGVALLWFAHFHLGKSFHSLVGLKSDQMLVETGPYRWIRHPIYTAYLLSYLGGGLLSGNWVLTFVPGPLFALLVIARIGPEEKMMVERFGQAYIAYAKRTGRLIPRFRHGG